MPVIEDWELQQLRLLTDRTIAIRRLADMLVRRKGNLSEAAGLPYQMFPAWALDEAKAMIESGNIYRETHPAAQPSLPPTDYQRQLLEAMVYKVFRRNADKAEIEIARDIVQDAEPAAQELGGGVTAAMIKELMYKTYPQLRPKSGNPGNPGPAKLDLAAYNRLKEDLFEAFTERTSRDIMDFIKMVLERYFGPGLNIAVAQHGEWIDIAGRRFQAKGSLEYEEMQKDLGYRILNLVGDMPAIRTGSRTAPGNPGRQTRQTALENVPKSMRPREEEQRPSSLPGQEMGGATPSAFPVQVYGMVMMFTPGFRSLSSDMQAKIMDHAMKQIHPVDEETGKGGPDMIVYDPEFSGPQRFEDQGRSMHVPVPGLGEKVYAKLDDYGSAEALSESMGERTGARYTVTFLLSSEY